MVQDFDYIDHEAGEIGHIEEEVKAPDRIISSHEMLEELNKVDPQRTFTTGYFHLDNMTKGFKEGDLVILSGLTGNGKTEYAVSLAKRYIEQKVYPVFFSYEISSQELLERFGQPVPLFYLPRLPQSKQPIWIEQKIAEASKNFGSKIVFIDHLHYLVDEYTTRSKNTSEMLGQLCRDFKQIARRQKVVVVLLAHVRKFSTSRPTIQDIKDSSGIVQEADVVMMIHRNGKKRSRKSAQELSFNEESDGEYEMDNSATLYLDKVRRRGGKLGNIKLVFEDGLYKEL